MMLKGSIQQEDITLVNIHAPNIGASKCIKKILVGIKGEIDSNTVIVGNFNTPLISMGISSRKKINKETVALNDTLGHQMDVIGIFRASHPKAEECTFFSSIH